MHWFIFSSLFHAVAFRLYDLRQTGYIEREEVSILMLLRWGDTLLLHKNEQKDDSCSVFSPMFLCISTNWLNIFSNIFKQILCGYSILIRFYIDEKVYFIF